MKSFEDALTFIKTWEGAFDGRDIARFAMFVPFDRMADCGLLDLEAGITPEEWGEANPWTEEEVLKQLKRDVEVGLEKAEDERGLSVSCMFAVVNMWCHLLENGLQENDYDNYGKRFFRKVLAHYGWD